jgi:Protein of unknown function (DUF3408).
MAKRQEVEVDEDLIKSMMTGDIPRLNNPPVEEKKVLEQKVEVPTPQKKNKRETNDDNDEESVEKNSISEDSQGSNKERETSQNKSKRKREPKDYQSLFLKKNGSNKRQTYVSADLHDKISKMLGIIAKDISVPNFIDNVLENHLNEYRDEINDIYRNNLDLTI